jgi:hypothetical protein
MLCGVGPTAISGLLPVTKTQAANWRAAGGGRFHLGKKLPGICLGCGKATPRKQAKYCGKQCAYAHKEKRGGVPQKYNRLPGQSRSLAAYHAKKHDPLFKAKKALRRQVWRVGAICKNQNNPAARGSSLSLGCSLEDAKAYLESKFLRGMSWDNYGEKWHIDHIIPICEFDLSEKSEARRANNILNLRPIWAEENLSKGGRILRDSQIPIGI